MRIGLQTWGTEGDVRPFFALANALKARGHSVRVLYTNVEAREFSALAKACGIEAEAVAAEYFIERREWLASRARESFGFWNPLQQVDRILEDLLDPVASQMLDAGKTLAKECDVFVSHFLTLPGHVAAAQADKPLVMVSFVPVLPTRECPPIGMPSLGRMFHRLQWSFANIFFERMFKPRINALRALAGLAPQRAAMDEALERTHLSLSAISPTLFSRPSDWHERAKLCGFLSLPTVAEAWEPEPALHSFLDAGAPPVFLSFGSMFNLDPEHTAKAVVVLGDAVEKAGVRGVIQAPEEVVKNAPRRASVHYLSRAPHVHLFPRCSLIVHHGGAGTTQSSLLAQRPSVVVPHAADQFYWGDVLYQRGVGGKPLRSTALTADRLAERIRAALEQPSLRQNAEALGALLAKERGPEDAAALIEASMK